MYKIEYTNEAYKQIEKLDETVKARIKKGIEYLAKDPTMGKMLTRGLKGRWSYRIGNYRIIYKIYYNKLITLVLSVGHRKEIYKRAMKKI